MKKKHTGFTLIELMITLVVAAITLSVGVPSFETFIISNRLTTNANEMISSINLARSEAIRRGAAVIVCSSNDQATCTNSSWESGWIVITAGGELIRVYSELKGSTTLSNADKSIQFTAAGFLNGNNTTFSICDSDETGEEGREIRIISTGRPVSTSPYPTCT